MIQEIYSVTRSMILKVLIFISRCNLQSVVLHRAMCGLFFNRFDIQTYNSREQIDRYLYSKLGPLHGYRK